MASTYIQKKYGGFNIVVIMDPCPNPWWFQVVV
jgi:hypothetical protein